MLSSFVLPSSPSLSPIQSEFTTGDSYRPTSARSSVTCSAHRSDGSIPKLKPFSRSRIDRWMPDPPLLQKTEEDLSDYCSTLEGDESYDCWKAYFELKDLEKEQPKEDVEKIVRQAGGTKTLINWLHEFAAMHKMKGKDLQKPTTVNAEEETRKPFTVSEETHKPFPVPDGLPKTQEELEEEENAKMPESPGTRMLRKMGRFPAWFSPAPDHETD